MGNAITVTHNSGVVVKKMVTPRRRSFYLQQIPQPYMSDSLAFSLICR